MLSCREVTQLTASDDLTTAGLRQRMAVRMHLLMCQHCRRYARQLRGMGNAVRQLARAAAPRPSDAELERRLLDLVRRRRESG